MVQRVIDQNAQFQNNLKPSFSKDHAIMPPKGAKQFSTFSSEIPQPKNTKPMPMAYTPMKDDKTEQQSVIDNKYFENRDDEGSLLD